MVSIAQHTRHEGDILKHGFSNDSTDELEIGKMIAIDTRSLVGLVGLGIGSTRFKECYLISKVMEVKSRLTEIGIENLLSQNTIPFPRNSSGINTIFIIEFDAQLPVLDFVTGPSLQSPERVFKDILTTDVEV